MTLEQFTFMAVRISSLTLGLNPTIQKPSILRLFWALHEHLTDEQIVLVLRGSGYTIDNAEELKETQRPVFITPLLSSLARVCAPLIITAEAVSVTAEAVTA